MCPTTIRSASSTEEGLEQHGVHDAEHRRIGADAEREGADGDQGEGRLAAQQLALLGC